MLDGQASPLDDPVPDTPDEVDGAGNDTGNGCCC
jgi:hypothetical protein